jgi:SAM-dependent methyltransferase
VLDLGAGTGKLTSRLVERGLDVVAVDPIAEMLEMLRVSLPDTPALLGTAEDIPLADNSVDAVLVAQAWHWFNPARAIPEVARVLRPGGRLGLVWNTRDERSGWVRELGRIIGRDGDPMRDHVTLPEPFTDVQRHQVEWTNYLTPQALIDLVASRSYCITSPTQVRTKTLDQVRERTCAALRHGGCAGDVVLTSTDRGYGSWCETDIARGRLRAGNERCTAGPC